MATRDNAFSPSPGGTINMNVTSTSGQGTFGTIATVAGGISSTCTFLNIGPNIVFVKIGQSGVTASATADMPLAIGYPVTLDMGDASNFAAVTLAGTSTLYATPGQGSI